MTVILTQTDSNYIELTLGMIKSIELNTSSFELIYINIGKVTDRERNLLKNASQKVRLIDSKANATETAALSARAVARAAAAGQQPEEQQRQPRVTFADTPGE